MTLSVTTYTRKPFDVEAVQVTEENFEEVSEWSGGVTSTETKEGEHYIQVDVKNAINVRQSRAYLGDYVVRMGKGFKVYQAKAFHKSFKATEPAPAV